MTTPEHESELVDVADFSFSELLAVADDSPLGQAAKTVVDDTERTREAISGWGSYIDLE